jgi:anaerobic selenocysteine-containing dehydrogenase
MLDRQTECNACCPRLVKRRRALVETTSPRNSQLKLIETDERWGRPHAQRIIDGKAAGAKVCVIDTRLSNTAAKADYWLSTWPGTEAAVLLAMANVLLREDLFDREFVRTWVNWEEYLADEQPGAPRTFATFVECLKKT